MPKHDYWNAELRLAEFDRLVVGVRRWVETAPPWPPLDRARSLWMRIAPRLDELKVNLDRVLVVGVVGGSGTGKSTLLNALVGRRICRAGDAERPTTRNPVVLVHPNVDASFLKLDDANPEICRLDVPLLRQMILVDCPDPDTQSRDADDPTAATNNRNLELLRRVLPHCDVLLCTGTAQKYKTQAVIDELLQHAPGRQAIFVQTHATIDADITADWQQHLQSLGFEVPQMFYLDGEVAIERAGQRRPAPPEFARLVDFLNEELAGRARHRILRTNALDLLDWFLSTTRADIEASWGAVDQLESAVRNERSRLFQHMAARLDEQLRTSRGIWRARLLREVTLRWGWGPFSAFLRVLGSARSMLRFLPAMRARGLGPMLVAGGLGAGQALVERIRESMAGDRWLAAGELGIGDGEIARAQSVLDGFAREAGIEPLRNKANATDESFVRAAGQLYERIETQIDSAVERRAKRRAGALFHGLLEILFTALPAVLLVRLGKDFFYDHLWLESSRPLLGIDYLIQSALWIVVWGLVLRGLLAWRLQRGLHRDITGIVKGFTPDTALPGLFDEFSDPVAALHEQANSLRTWSTELDRLRHELQSTDPSQLGRWRIEAVATK